MSASSITGSSGSSGSPHKPLFHEGKKLDPIEQIVSDFIELKLNISESEMRNQVKGILIQQHPSLKEDELETKTDKKITKVMKDLYHQAAPSSSSQPYRRGASPSSRSSESSNRVHYAEDVTIHPIPSLLSPEHPDADIPTPEELDLDKVPNKSILRTYSTTKPSDVEAVLGHVCPPENAQKYKQTFAGVVASLNLLLTHLKDKYGNTYSLKMENLIDGEKEWNDFYNHIDAVVEASKASKATPGTSSAVSLNESESSTTFEQDAPHKKVRRVKKVTAEPITPVHSGFWLGRKDLRTRVTHGSGDKPPPSHAKAPVHDGDIAQVSANLNEPAADESPEEAHARKSLVDGLHMAIQYRYDEKYSEAKVVVEEIVMKMLTGDITDEDLKPILSKRYLIMDQLTPKDELMIGVIQSMLDGEITDDDINYYTSEEFAVDTGLDEEDRSVIELIQSMVSTELTSEEKRSFDFVVDWLSTKATQASSQGLVLPLMYYRAINVLAPWVNAISQIPHPSRTGWEMNAHHSKRTSD